MTKPEHIKVMKNDQAEVERFVLLGQPRREARSCRMSVDVTKLPSGLTVVTDTMPHLETAALGVWAGVGGRDEKPNEHGISHLLEHMAFKGTTRRTVARDRRGNRGGRRRSQRRHLDRDHGLLCAGAEGRRAAGARRAVRHSRQSVLRAGRTGAREERHRAGDRRGAGYARRRRVRASQRALLSRISRWAARCSGTAKTLKRLRSRHAARLSVDALSRARHGGGGRRRGRSQAGGRGSGAALRQLRRHAGAEAASRRCSARAAPASCIAISNRRI